MKRRIAIRISPGVAAFAADHDELLQTLVRDNLREGRGQRRFHSMVRLDSPRIDRPLLVHLTTIEDALLVCLEEEAGAAGVPQTSWWHNP